MVTEASATPGVLADDWTVTLPAAASVTSGQKATATVKNVRKAGSLEVTKSIDWKGVTPTDGLTFEFCVTGPVGPGSVSQGCRIVTYHTVALGAALDSGQSLGRVLSLATTR